MASLAVRYASKPGYELSSVMVDGVEVADSSPSAYWFYDVDASHRIHVVYRPMEMGVTVNYYRDAVAPDNLLGTYQASARVDDRFAWYRRERGKDVSMPRNPARGIGMA